MAVCAHAQTAIIFFGAESRRIHCGIRFGPFSPVNPSRRIRVARFTVAAYPVATFADFCAIFLFSRPLPGFHDARL
jgi:hypothetical protein